MRTLVVLCLLARVAAADPDFDWDGTYADDDVGGGELCPHFEKSTSVTVANGAFTIDWKIRAGNDELIRVGTLTGTVRPSGMATIGRVEGSIAANGKVTLRTSLTVSELPPEIADGKPEDEASTDYVRAFKFTGTFTISGKAHYGTIESGSDCEMRFESASTFKQGRSVAPKKAANGEKCSRDYDCSSGFCDSAGHCAKK